MTQLLVSTPLHIFKVDLASGKSTVVRLGDGYYYGISSSGNRLALTHTAGYLQLYQKNHPTITTCSNLIDPHQCEWIDDLVLVANTARNCLTVYDQAGRCLQDVYLNEIHIDRKDSSRIGNHFNSVHRVGNSVYVVAHNYERPSEVYTLTWPELEVVRVQQTRANWAHNIWICDLGTVICDSRHGALLEVNTGEVIWSSNEADALTRGLAVNPEHIFVGYSTQTIRKERFWNSGGIWVIDRKTLTTIDKIVLPGSGQVHEIRILDEQDECHNGEIITTAALAAILRRSLITGLAYHARRRYPALQRDLPLVSQIVRFKQIVRAWTHPAGR